MSKQKKPCDHSGPESLSGYTSCRQESYCCEYEVGDGHNCSRYHEYELIVSCSFCGKTKTAIIATDLDQFINYVLEHKD